QQLSVLLEPPAAQATVTRKEETRRIIYVADVAQSVSSGDLVIQAVVSRLKKNGDWSKPAFQESSIKEVSTLDDGDQRILALLAASAEVPAYYSSPYSFLEPDSLRSRFRLLPGARDLLISMLSDTGRFFCKPAQPADALYPLTWDSGPAWSVKVEVERNA